MAMSVAAVQKMAHPIAASLLRTTSSVRIRRPNASYYHPTPYTGLVKPLSARFLLRLLDTAPCADPFVGPHRSHESRSGIRSEALAFAVQTALPVRPLACTSELLHDRMIMSISSDMEQTLRVILSNVPRSIAHPTIADPGTPAYQRALDEYKEAGINFRHNGDIRFKQLTLFGAVTAILVTALASKRVDSTVKWIIPGVGVVATACFYLLEKRTTDYRLKYFHVAEDLEKILGFTEYNHTRLGLGWYSLTVLKVLFGTAGFIWAVVEIIYIGNGIAFLLGLIGLL